MSHGQKRRQEATSRWRKRLRTECVMKLYAEYSGQWNKHHGNWRWWKLLAASHASGLPSFDAHGALADAQATVAILRHLAAQAQHVPVVAMESWERPLPQARTQIPASKSSGCFGVFALVALLAAVAVPMIGRL